MIYKKPRLSEKERKIYEDREKILQTGQDSELKGARVTSQLFRESQLKEADQRADFLTLLRWKQHKNDYNRELAKILVVYLKEEDLDRDVGFETFFDTKGVIMYLFYRGRTFQRAFRAVRDPVIDLNAAKMFAISASGLVSKLKQDGPANITAD